MRGTWQLQEAKNRFSEVVDRALDEGPQIVTRHGEPVAVIVAKADFDKRRPSRAARGTLLTFLRHLSFARAHLELERPADVDRDLDL